MNKNLLKIIFNFCFCLNIIGFDFESSNYYMSNYLFDSQIYAQNTFVTENYLSKEIDNYSPYFAFLQYQSLDNYQESDFGVGSEYKLNDKITLDLGSWYYFYYSAGGHYFEPYFSVSYDGIVTPKFYISGLSYNWEYRSVLSVEKELSYNKLSYTPKIVAGTVNYDGYRYFYTGFINRVDYKINETVKLFASHEFDKPFESIDNSIVQSFIAGITISY